MAPPDDVAGESFFCNGLLASLPRATLDQLRPSLVRVELVNGQVLHERGEMVRDVFFMKKGVGSIVMPNVDDGENTDGANGGGVEVGLIGPEGLVGWWVLLDPEAVAPQRAIIQVPGQAWRMAVSNLQMLADRDPDVRRMLLRYAHAHTIQVAQTAACNVRHTLSERLARWLLMTHDRVAGDVLPLTHEFVGIMLGVRRSGVTVAASTLQAAGLIRYARGRITVLDRAGLEHAACDCYRIVQTQFERLLGPKSQPP